MAAPAKDSPPCFPRGVVVNEYASDSEEMKRLAMLWSIEQDQLEPGPYRGRIAAFHTDRIQVGFSERSAGTLAHGHCPAGAIVIAAVFASPKPCYFRMATVARRELLVVWPDEDFTFQPMGASRVITVAAAIDYLLPWVERTLGLPLETRCVDGRLTVAEGESVDAIGRQLLQLIEDIVRAPGRIAGAEDCARLDEKVLQMILGPVERAARKFRKFPRREIALKAKSFLDENRRQPLRVRELTRRTGRSARNLEKIFHEAFGMSLKARLQTVRLNGARRDMLAAAGTDRLVKEIALDWGFLHLGRFAVTYRKWFGETPLDTLRGGASPGRKTRDPLE